MDSEKNEPLLSDKKITATMSENVFRSILDRLGAQLGEIVWYDQTLDPRIDAVVTQQSAEILNTIRDHLNPEDPGFRILEVGAYCHYSMHKLADQLKCEAVATDITPISLRAGRALARDKGYSASATLVSCDFHDLPFADGAFDFVYIASAVHHTWRTRQVLDELLRVVRPGGVLMLANEPVGRELCTYSFRGNRLQTLLPMEKALHDAGLLCTISSPFPGSRDEENFGMIENDRIPWRLFEEFTAAGEILELSIIPVIGELEQTILDNRMGPSAVAGEINRRLQNISDSTDDFADLTGFRLPDSKMIDTLCYQIEPDLFAQAADDLPTARARLFGAALKAILRKPGETVRAAAVWRRGLALSDGVHVEEPRIPGVRVDLDQPMIPLVRKENEIQLKDHFTPAQWDLVQQGPNSWAIHLLGNGGEIVLPKRNTDAILLLRFYAVAHPSGPYGVTATVENGESAFCLIFQNESRLMRLPVHSTAMKVTLKIESRVPEHHSYAHHLRIGACRLVLVDLN